MPQFDVAHIREQGQNMIIIPLDDSFGYKTSGDKNQIINNLERHAHAAGLAGSVVVMWQSGGRTSFIAPRPWHQFFQSLSFGDVLASINKQISW